MPLGAVLTLATLAHALGALAALAVAPLSPLLLDAFGLSRLQVGLLLPAVYLGGVLMSLPAGWLTDRFGVRGNLGLGQVLTGAMVILAALSSGFGAMLACLVAAGFGFSVLNPGTGKAIVEWFPPRRRGMAMGIKQTGLTLGILTAALTLPPLAAATSWRHALAAAGAASIGSGALVLLAYRSPRQHAAVGPAERPRLAELSLFFQRRAVLVVFACGLLLSIAQSSVLAYLALFVKETFAFSAVVAGQVLALAQAGGTASRLAWGVLSDRSFGGRRRPGIIASALIGAAAYALFALGAALPASIAVAVAFVAGAGAFGWVGLYFALIAEIGGPRYAGLLTGVATAFAWTGTLIGPPLFGGTLEATGSYTPPWLLLTGIALGVAAALPRLRPLVQRG
ncbi:MAG TPA: MFS transporter [Methylomirabilota bacterium]|nr:MFS transporter [Methylomirabilota bacterium]